MTPTLRAGKQKSAVDCGGGGGDTRTRPHQADDRIRAYATNTHTGETRGDAVEHDTIKKLRQNGRPSLLISRTETAAFRVTHVPGVDHEPTLLVTLARTFRSQTSVAQRACRSFNWRGFLSNHFKTAIPC